MISNTELINLLKQGAQGLNINISDIQAGKFMQYMSLLKEWNTKVNLTAIEDEEGIIIKHFIDSLTILPCIEENASVIDIGSGAGFPGIPLKIMNPSIELTLLDSLEKRIKFLNEVISRVKLDRVNAVHGRAEDFGKDGSYREKFSYSIARAVANLPVLLEYCIPFVKIGGCFIAMKGRNTAQEIEESKKALDVFGGEITEIKEFILPYTDSKRTIIIIKKLRQTPTSYPRKSGKPSKNPLK
ncbi:MAG: 16S rRNA (guanine(527)-N(7))-methyltransferase RsmG [Acetivibrionales bacterium]|jgi:16S rRNA (guanine527-N7)-methyltransferase